MKAKLAPMTQKDIDYWLPAAEESVIKLFTEAITDQIMKAPTIKRPWVKHREQSHGSRSHDKFYQTSRWRNDRKAHLTANPLCVHCQAEGRVEPATVSDHIVPIEQGGDPWDWANRQGLCASHHNKKSAKERKR